MFANGSLGMHRIWWSLQCSHLIVPLCIVVYPVGARLTAVCGAALCPVALLLAFLPISGSFFPPPVGWGVGGGKLSNGLV